MFSEEVLKEAQSVISDALASGITVASAESCTGGLVAGALTAISGSSSVLKGSVVSYTIEIKQKVLGVSKDILLNLNGIAYNRALKYAIPLRLSKRY